jgi:sterol desaturase/sphingolipid hydroxylase (fatty acid hydroxylase superfamily)
MLGSVPSSTDAHRAHHQPYYDALERRQSFYSAAYASLPWDEIRRSAKRKRLTKEMTR